jgi:hypothetical protein
VVDDRRTDGIRLFNEITERIMRRREQREVDRMGSNAKVASLE